MDLRLTGKRAIVTGGSRGIGKAIALELAQEGVRVVVVARSERELKTAASELSGRTGVEVVPIVADTGDDRSVRAMVESAVAALGGLDILINAAAQPGGAAVPSLATLEDGAIWTDLNVKVLGYLRCIRAAAPHLAASGSGRIVNISGLAARRTGSIVGSMRNVAVAAMTKNLAEELSKDRITTVVVHPGLTATERTPSIIQASSQAEGRSEAEISARLGAGNLVGRLIEASEVAAVVAFLCSPRADIINGDAVAVGGGDRGSIHY